MKIAFVIHHINNFGGQERSTLELINRCAKTHETHVFSHTLEGASSNVVFHKIPLTLIKPFFLKDFMFRAIVTMQLFRNNFDIVNATGNCSVHSNVVTIQFVQKRWRQERAKMKTKKNWRWWLAEIQSLYDVCLETIVYGILKKKWYIALSNSVAQDLKTFYDIKKIKVIPHGVNLEEFAPSSETRASVRKAIGVSEKETLLLFVGTYERKGLFYLLPAFAKIARQYNLKLCVVGSGPRQKAHDTVHALGISDLVHFTEYPVKAAPYYQAADLFVLPSLYDPFGLVGIEALASGVPSIISVQSGVSDLIKPEVNGWLLQDPTSEKEIEAALTKAVSDKTSLDKMKLTARESVLDSSWDSVWLKYEELYSLCAKESK